MGISVLQCEIGTTPIIGFVAPFALTGSFYLRTGEEFGDVWNNSASLMFIASGVVSLILWGISGWALQSELEYHYDDLTRPLPQNADLEWLDYLHEEITKRAAIHWKDVPA